MKKQSILILRKVKTKSSKLEQDITELGTKPSNSNISRVEMKPFLNRRVQQTSGLLR